MRISALYLLIFWFIYQFLNLGIQGSNVAWFAHIGGFVFGFLYSLFFVNKPRSINIKKGKSVFLKKRTMGLTYSKSFNISSSFSFKSGAKVIL